MSTQKSDIASRKELMEFLHMFYQLAQSDEIIGSKFKNVNMDEHIEVIGDFWSSILFGSNQYHGDPFGKHMPLKLIKSDFNKWVALFEETMNSNYAGKNAEEMKTRARSIATIFQYKLGL